MKIPQVLLDWAKNEPDDVLDLSGIAKADRQDALRHIAETDEATLLADLEDGMRSLRGPSVHKKRQQILHSIADDHEASVKKVVLAALAAGKSKIRNSTPSKAADAAANAIRTYLTEKLPKVLLPIVQEVGMSTSRHIRVAAAEDIEATFDITDPNAIEWARKHAAEQAKNISETTREAIANAVADTLEGGDIADLYDRIEELVGDEARADVITRTEVMSAVNEGQRQSWDQAVEDGLLTGNEKRVWITAPDACPECAVLEGETADLDGQYPGDGGDGPPLHPNCRCTEGLTLG